jgi:hypothetical protein
MFYWSADYNTTIETQNVSLSPTNFTLNYSDIWQSTPHSHVFSLFCNDYAGNIINYTDTFNFDLVTPECLNLTEAVEVNEGTEYLWDLYCVDDINYYSLDVACVGGTDYTFYQDNINATVFHFQETAGHLNTDMNCEFTSSDAHTKQSIAKELNKWNVKKKGNAVSVPNNDRLIEYTSASGMTALDFDFSSIDRIKLNYKFDKNPSNKIIDYVYKVNGNDKVQYIENSLYSGWFVVDDKYWVDFEIVDKTGVEYIIDMVNDTSWSVTLRTKRTDFNFNSVGIINTKVQKQYIRVIPADQVSGLETNQCPISLNGTMILWLMVGIAFALILFGWMTGIGILGIFGSIGLIVLSWTIVGCSLMFGWLLAITGLFMLIWFALRKPTINNEVFR